MAFFQELGKHLSGAAQSVGKRTTEAAEVSRLNGKVQRVNEQIEALYSQIGKAYYATRNAAGVHEAADRLCLKIDELNAQLQGLKKQVDKIRRQNRCPNCGGVQPSSSRFCASCGTRLPEEETVASRVADGGDFEHGDDVNAQDGDGGGDEDAADIDLTGVTSREHVSVEINWPKSRPAEPEAGDGDSDADDQDD